ncbi:MAG TPA: hypothetical protein VGB59_02610 [Allosphingosinicella sp.]|jgi:hypothetical protein
MKAFVFAAALTVAGAALAQTTDTTAQTGGTMVAPGNTAPARDARGIPVVSEGAMAPDGWNQPARTVPAGTPMPAPATTITRTDSGPLPPCTRTRTDRCVQTYERGVAR